MAVKKHKLDMAIQEDFCLLGIVTDDPDYKVCWRINQALDMMLVKQDDLVLFHKKLDTDQSFSVFSFDDEEALLTYRIIGNRGEPGYFLDELRNLDYLVHIQGEISAERINHFLNIAASLTGVRMAVPVDLAKIRQKERLYLW